MNPTLKTKLIPILIVAAVALAGYYGWSRLKPAGPGAGFVSGNGRIEATEVDVATKLPGRVDDIMVAEGEFVTAGQPLAKMQVQSLEAQRDEARAQHQQLINAVASAEAQVAARASDKAAMQALVAQRESELDAAQRRLVRSETLAREGATSRQELDDDRARVRSVRAAVAAAQAQVAAAQAAIDAAKAQVVGAGSAVTAAQATIARVQADIADSQLRAPRAGRAQLPLPEAQYLILPEIAVHSSYPFFDIRDETITVRKLDWLREFSKRYKEEIGIRFKCLAEPATMAFGDVSDEKIRLLVEAGLTDIIIGQKGSKKHAHMTLSGAVILYLRDEEGK